MSVMVVGVVFDHISLGGNEDRKVRFRLEDEVYDEPKTYSEIVLTMIDILVMLKPIKFNLSLPLFFLLMQ